MLTAALNSAECHVGADAVAEALQQRGAESSLDRKRQWKCKANGHRAARQRAKRRGFLCGLALVQFAARARASLKNADADRTERGLRGHAGELPDDLGGGAVGHRPRVDFLDAAQRLVHHRGEPLVLCLLPERSNDWRGQQVHGSRSAESGSRHRVGQFLVEPVECALKVGRVEVLRERAQPLDAFTDALCRLIWNGRRRRWHDRLFHLRGAAQWNAHWNLAPPGVGRGRIASGGTSIGLNTIGWPLASET